MIPARIKSHISGIGHFIFHDKQILLSELVQIQTIVRIGKSNNVGNHAELYVRFPDNIALNKSKSNDFNQINGLIGTNQN